MRVGLLQKLLGTAPTTTIAGVIDRFGPDFRPGSIEGYVLTLVGDARVYRVLRSAQVDDYPVGLTCSGDDVTFDAEDDGYVRLTSFINCTLKSQGQWKPSNG